MGEHGHRRAFTRGFVTALALTLGLGRVSAGQDAGALAADGYRPVAAFGTLRIEPLQREAAVVLRFRSSYDEDGSWTNVPAGRRLVVEGLSVQGTVVNTSLERQPEVMVVTLAGEARSTSSGVSVWAPRWQHVLTVPWLYMAGDRRFLGSTSLRQYAQGGGTREERLTLRVTLHWPNVPAVSRVTYSVSGYLQ